MRSAAVKTRFAAAVLSLQTLGNASGNSISEIYFVCVFVTMAAETRSPTYLVLNTHGKRLLTSQAILWETNTRNACHVVTNL